MGEVPLSQTKITAVVQAFGVRRPVGALAAGDSSPAASRQVATDESGDRSPHSTIITLLYNERSCYTPQ